jgi:hypothetical protein
MPFLCRSASLNPSHDEASKKEKLHRTRLRNKGFGRTFTTLSNKEFIFQLLDSTLDDTESAGEARAPAANSKACMNECTSRSSATSTPG